MTPILWLFVVELPPHSSPTLVTVSKWDYLFFNDVIEAA